MKKTDANTSTDTTGLDVPREWFVCDEWLEEDGWLVGDRDVEDGLRRAAQRAVREAEVEHGVEFAREVRARYAPKKKSYVVYHGGRLYGTGRYSEHATLAEARSSLRQCRMVCGGTPFIEVEDATDATDAKWTYEGYWNVVMGESRDAADVVHEFGLNLDGLEAWLSFAEQEAWREGGHEGSVPAEWAAHRERACSALLDAMAAGPC